MFVNRKEKQKQKQKKIIEKDVNIDINTGMHVSSYDLFIRDANRHTELYLNFKYNKT